MDCKYGAAGACEGENASKMEAEQSKPVLNVHMDDSKKKSSRDAARQRRGQQNDEYSEIALQLPLPPMVVEKLDRLCVMRLSNSFIKIKHILHEIEDGTRRVPYKWEVQYHEHMYNSFIQNALGGFVFVLAEDGQCLYVSPNVCEFLGLQQLDLTGHSIYKYVHPCDQDNLAQQLGGHAPLADMEIFDGLFCSEPPPQMEKPPKPAKKAFENSAHRSFFMRMKSTLTSRGKSVNINASIHRVVHCTGTIQMYRMKRGISNGSITRCFIGIGTPLLSNTTFEVPIDQSTFITKHALDMKVISIEMVGSNILGYPEAVLRNKSWYSYCHVCDVNVLKDCHDAVLQKGQSVSAYYRVMVQNGGWVWLQTTANVVYSSSTRLPTYIVCTQYIISGVELGDKVLSIEQYSHVKKKKRSKIGKEEPEKADVSDMSPPTVKPKTESGSPVYEYNFPTKDIIKSEGNSHPLGEADGSSENSSNTALLVRCPWIPYPLHDAEIKQFPSLDDPVSPTPSIPVTGIGEAARSPRVPEPTIDKILSFEDLSFPDLYDQDLEFDDSDSTTGSEQSSEEIYGVLRQLPNVVAPAHFLYKYDIFKEGTSKDAADCGKVFSNLAVSDDVHVS